MKKKVIVAFGLEVFYPNNVYNVRVAKDIINELISDDFKDKKIDSNTELVLVFKNNQAPNFLVSSVDDIEKQAFLVKMLEEKTENKKRIFKLSIIKHVEVKQLYFGYDGDDSVLDSTLAEYKEVEVKDYKDESKLLDSLQEKVLTLLKAHTIFGDIHTTLSQTLAENKSDSVTNIKYLISFLKETVDLNKTLAKQLIRKPDLVEQVQSVIELIHYLVQEKEIVDSIDTIMKKNLDKQQTEFILREKMKIIRQKLDEQDVNEDKKEEELAKPLDQNKFPEEAIAVIKNETRKLKGMMSSSPEANISKTYLDLIYSLPWKKVAIEHLNIEKAEKILSEKHYGLEKVKERILEFLAVLTNKKEVLDKQNKNKLFELPNQEEAIDSSLFSKDSDVPRNNMPILTLVGPPGTGKTSIAKSIADATGRKMIKISLGGVKDESEIRGHRRTYVGALPGKIISAIKKAGVSNPIILLDEIDKMSSDFKGDPASAMLEVLDPEQNKHFQDHYLELEYDLSKVLFIATANYFEGIPHALADRVEIIELSSYTLLEKVQIAKEHLIPKVLEENMLESKYFEIDEKTIEFVIQKYTREAGVRDLKRNFDKLARKIITKLLKKEISSESYKIDQKVAKELLGVERFSDDINEKEAQVGAVNGLAYTSYGGSTLSIEVTTIESPKADLKLTGQLKDVMRESAEIALSFVKSKAKEFDIDFDFEKHQIHIHVPEGAVPKDGPSAGVTFTTAIISALSKKPVSPKVGMTGEITLRGKVLAIGGLKEKSLAAYKFGIDTIFIPQENERNLVDIAEEVKKNVKFIPVSNYQEIYDVLFKNTKKVK
ncbi:endopeptidase La [Mycoplasma procyoni]|uniref:endopeptidase La n=1 Tax=Mycoplasma procyoni TaxID=568784 RepID=UPI00197B3411|nr:endopeptidase La [Mycoplasma procyoni]MBN3535117.1 endopeptidase La [Mycoplasma procyoni]